MESENEKRKGIYVDIEQELLKQFKIRVVTEERTIRDVVADLIKRYLSE